MNTNKKAKENRYPEYIMKKLRQHLGLESNDTSRDDEINTYSGNEAFEGVLEWEGICGYTEFIKMWIQDIYEIDLNEYTFAKADKEPKEFNCTVCPYHWQDGDEEYPSCQYKWDDGYAPCERQEEPEEYDYEEDNY